MKWIEIEGRFVNLEKVVWIEKYEGDNTTGIKIMSEKRFFSIRCDSDKTRDEKFKSIVEQIKQIS